MRISLYTLPHGEPKFSLNESDINIVTVAAYRGPTALSKATCVIPISFEAKSYKSYKCPV